MEDVVPPSEEALRDGGNGGDEATTCVFGSWGRGGGMVRQRLSWAARAAAATLYLAGLDGKGGGGGGGVQPVSITHNPVHASLGILTAVFFGRRAHPYFLLAFLLALLAAFLYMSGCGVGGSWA